MSSGKAKATARVTYKVLGPDGKVKYKGESDSEVQFKTPSTSTTENKTKSE